MKDKLKKIIFDPIFTVFFVLLLIIMSPFFGETGINIILGTTFVFTLIIIIYTTFFVK